MGFFSSAMEQGVLGPWVTLFYLMGFDLTSYIGASGGTVWEFGGMRFTSARPAGAWCKHKKKIIWGLNSTVLLSCIPTVLVSLPSRRKGSCARQVNTTVVSALHICCPLTESCPKNIAQSEDRLL
jgi:hypothetical protein